jgi:histidyl-tRNA synthetase
MSTAPSIIDYLNEESRVYFDKVKQHLTDLEIDFVEDPTLVRGLDYYNHTAFEIMSEAEGFGAITTLAGGGRYNGLAESLGGPETPGIGFALSIERLIAALQAENVELPIEKGIDCFLVSLGDEARDYTVKLAYQLRNAGFTVEKDYLDRKVKAQFKSADRLEAKYVAVLGDDELSINKINLKNMATGEQVELDLATFVEQFKKL